MRYPLGALFLASCTMLAPLPVEHQPIGPPASAIHSGSTENWAETRNQKPKISSSPLLSSTSEISSCASLDAGDLKETIKAKLDCITENAR